jgi:hypothetical protein
MWQGQTVSVILPIGNESDWTMTREDTRAAAPRWFESRVPEDEKVVIDLPRFWDSVVR